MVPLQLMSYSYRANTLSFAAVVGWMVVMNLFVHFAVVKLKIESNQTDIYLAFTRSMNRYAQEVG